ncbi:hypothetical protein [Paeniglutamicibacter cryotolerans]|uniref:Chemotaxis protein n=1 Tax=Paeniglutamicibacter cryotolerans TaxID=670079 RepID=A0A839QL73_9MICC|nr:hypothetical protein [Paeniglutamicibacter cryotolerans]MBB2995335.1 hypothetical protein [Paeniglutamicibacter cryotolerans]
MGFFSAAREARRDEKELGIGVWRRANDRFSRGLDRFHQVIEGIQDDDLYNALVMMANHLAELQDRVRAVCTSAQAQSPSDDSDIPHRYNAVHRALSKAANDLAMTAQSAAMARLDGERWGYASAGLENVARRADTVGSGVAAAEAALAEAFANNS